MSKKLDIKMTHEKLLSLIGEVDGIYLTSHNGFIKVYLRIGDKEIEVIRDNHSQISHNITRLGIGEILEKFL